jgi:hypothetical protein
VNDQPTFRLVGNVRVPLIQDLRVWDADVTPSGAELKAMQSAEYRQKHPLLYGGKQ